VTRSVDNEEAWDFQIKLLTIMNTVQMILKVLFREIGCTDLLGNTSSFSSLHIGASELIQDECFTGIDVTENTNDRASQFFLLLL